MDWLKAQLTVVEADLWKIINAATISIVTKKVDSLDQRGNLDIFGQLLSDIRLSRSHPDSGKDIQSTIWGVSHFVYAGLWNVST